MRVLVKMTRRTGVHVSLWMSASRDRKYRRLSLITLKGEGEEKSIRDVRVKGESEEKSIRDVRVKGEGGRRGRYTVGRHAEVRICKE